MTTGANLPQVYKVIKTRSTKSLSTKSLSAISFVMLFLGSITWVIYGIYRDDIPIILANSIAGSLHGIILFIKITSKNQK